MQQLGFILLCLRKVRLNSEEFSSFNEFNIIKLFLFLYRSSSGLEWFMLKKNLLSATYLFIPLLKPRKRSMLIR